MNTHFMLLSASLAFLSGCIGASVSKFTKVEGLAQCAVRVPGDYYIAALFPYEGQWPVGPALESGLIEALDEINEAGGIGADHRTLGAVLCNDKGSPEVAKSIVDEIMEVRPQVVAMIGPVNGASVLAAIKEAVKKGGLPHISPVANTPALALLDDRGFLFRPAPSVETQARAAILAGALQLTDRVLIVSQADDDDSVSLATAIQAQVKSLGIVPYETLYSPDEPDFIEATLQGMQIYSPEVIFLIGAPSHTANIVKNAAENRFRPKRNWVFPAWQKDTGFVTAVNHDNYLDNTAVGIGPSHTLAPTNVMFSNQFQNNWGELPTVYADHVYDAVFSLAMAMHRLNDVPSRAGLRLELNVLFGPTAPTGGISIRPGEWGLFVDSGNAPVTYDGATGIFALDEKRTRSVATEIWQIRDGVPKITACIAPDGTPCQ